MQKYAIYHSFNKSGDVKLNKSYLFYLKKKIYIKYQTNLFFVLVLVFKLLIVRLMLDCDRIIQINKHDR
jgi:hypothetical protein